MTEEENKAIEMLKDRQKDLLEGSKSSFYSSDRELYKEHAEAIDTILNLIEKLQKENEELKNKVVKRDKELIKLEEYANKNFERKDDVKAKYIPKDKIREKLEKIEKEKKQYYDAGQPLIYMLLKNQLKSLIEEKQ